MGQMELPGKKKPDFKSNFHISSASGLLSVCFFGYCRKMSLTVPAPLTRLTILRCDIRHLKKKRTQYCDLNVSLKKTFMSLGIFMKPSSRELWTNEN